MDSAKGTAPERDLTFPRKGTDRPQLVANAKASLLARAAKYNDPDNYEYEWDNAGKFERHALSAVQDLVKAEARIAQLEQALRAAMHTIEGYRHGNVSHDLANEVLPVIRAALNDEQEVSND